MLLHLAIQLLQPRQPETVSLELRLKTLGKGGVELLRKINLLKDSHDATISAEAPTVLSAPTVMHNASFAILTADIGLSSRLVILALQAWVLYWWFKRQKRLDTLGNVIRVEAITAGISLMFLWVHMRNVLLKSTLDSFEKELRLARLVGLPAAALIAVFLFFPDASYFIGQGLRKLFHREPIR